MTHLQRLSILLRKHSNAIASQPYKRAKRAPSMQLRILLAGLLVWSVSSHAEQTIDPDGSQWSEWEAIDKGYIARKKVPPRLNLPRAERALKTGKAQRSRLLKRKAKLQTRMRAAGPKKLSKLRAKLNSINTQLRQLQAANRTSIAASQGGAWLYNGTEGLHSVSVAELATALGQTEKFLVRRLKKGRLALTNNGQAVPYHYDQKTGQVLYVAESYKTIYTDDNAYRARFSSIRSQTMKIRKEAARKGTGKATAFLDTLLFEEEPDMFFDVGSTRAEQDVDYWFWDYLFGPYKDSITVALNAPNPAATGNAQLRIKMRGWTDLYEGDEHQVSAELNGQTIGAVLTWDAFDQAILVADFDQSMLSATGENSLVMRSIYSEGTTPGEYLNNIELDYMRLPVAQDGQLWLHQAPRGKQRVSGFGSDNIVVIEDPTGAAVLRKDIRLIPDSSGFSAVFRTKENIDYLVAEQTAIAAPAIAEAEVATLANAANMGEYLIIAPRDFADTAEALARLREAQFGSVKTVWLDQIYAEYSAGRADPFAIGRFMSDISATWSVAPTHVVIVGNGTLDHKNRMGYDESFVPPLLTVTLDIGPPWTLASSDDRLLGANGDAAFAIGRIPILSNAEGLAYVEKLSRHAQEMPNSSWERAVLVADNPDSAGQFHDNSDILSDWMLDSLGFTETTKLYHPTTQVRPTLIDSATWDNHGYLTYDGHGTVSQLGNFRENFITKVDAEALSNSGYPLFTALTCAAGEYIFPGMRSVTAAMVLNPTGGAIAAMAPSGLSLDQDAQFMGYVFAGTLFGSTRSTVGEALQRAKLLSDGEVNSFMTRIYSVVGDPAVSVR